jgi:hypothetical protein
MTDVKRFPGRLERQRKDSRGPAQEVPPQAGFIGLRREGGFADAAV